MKFRTFTLLFLSVFAVSLMAQKPEASIAKVDVPPTIDGVIDEMWADVEAFDIDQTFIGDALPPTVGLAGETYWKMVWDDAGVYLLLNVTDDDFFPNWADDPVGTNDWQYDKPEVYFDVNYILEDAKGSTNAANHGNGHYQFAPGITEENMDGMLGYFNDAVEYAIVVTDPNYVVEYFIPMDYMQNEEGGAMDPTAEIGFDVTIIDRDQTREMTDRSRAVWANVGNVNESWNNMDDCGIITFEGADPPTLVETVELTGGEITTNNGELQIGVVITPAEATTTRLAWSIDGYESGVAGVKISPDGLVTGVLDGTYTIVGSTTDGTFIDATTEVVVSGQIVTRGEINLFRNGNFDELNEDGLPAEWNVLGEVEAAMADGAVVLSPTGRPNIWDNRFQQKGPWGLNTEDNYELSFVMWADASDTMNLDFEDARSEVSWNRYGESTHEYSNGGQSEWQFDSPTDPTKYVFDVTFSELVEESIEEFAFMIGHHGEVFYLDSLELVNLNDLDLVDETYVPIETLVIDEGETTVAMGETLQLSATVTPAEATETGVYWSTMPVTGGASIDETGLLTPDSTGTVMVYAKAMDDSKLEASVEVTVTGPVGIAKKEVTTLKVYPNPAVNELNVVTDLDNTVSIYNSVGVLMDEVVSGGTTLRLDISDYPAGIYFVKSDNAIAKFVK